MMLNKYLQNVEWFVVSAHVKQSFMWHVSLELFEATFDGAVSNLLNIAFLIGSFAHTRLLSQSK